MRYAGYRGRGCVSEYQKDKSSYYGVPICQYGTKEILGGAIGKEQRSSLAVCDAGLAQAVMRALEGEGVCQVKGGSEHGKNEGT